MASNSPGNTDAYDLVEQSAYKKYDVDNVNLFDPGVFILPVASEVSASVKVRMHGGFSKRTVKYKIAKQGNPPVVPLPSDTVGTDVLTQAIVNVPTPIPNLQTGGYDWVVEGQYDYVTKGTARLFGVDVLPVTSYPYVNLRQDAIAAQSMKGATPEAFSLTLKTANMIATGGYIWPLTVYPSNLLMNPLLLG